MPFMAAPPEERRSERRDWQGGTVFGGFWSYPRHSPLLRRRRSRRRGHWLQPQSPGNPQIPQWISQWKWEELWKLETRTVIRLNRETLEITRKKNLEASSHLISIRWPNAAIYLNPWVHSLGSPAPWLVDIESMNTWAALIRGKIDHSLALPSRRIIFSIRKFSSPGFRWNSGHRSQGSPTWSGQDQPLLKAKMGYELDADQWQQTQIIIGNNWSFKI